MKIGFSTTVWHELQHHDLLEDNRGGRWRVVYIDAVGFNRPINVSEDGAMHGRESRVRLIGDKIFVLPGGSAKAQALSNGFNVLPRQPLFRGNNPAAS